MRVQNEYLYIYYIHLQVQVYIQMHVNAHVYVYLHVHVHCVRREGLGQPACQEEWKKFRWKRRIVFPM
jgi:hypothetical protein